MRLCIVPMKPLARAKQRLAEVLTPEQRRALSLAMLADVCEAARPFDAVWVLNSDEDAAEIARAAGAEPRPDPTPDAGLNASLAAATAAAMTAGAQGILIVSADVPCATTEDLTLVAGSPGVGLVSDHGGQGTNVLWRDPGNAIGVAFGPGSRRAHERLAAEAGMTARVLDLPRLALDVDRPEDLAAARALGPGPRTADVLASIAGAAPAR